MASATVILSLIGGILAGMVLGQRPAEYVIHFGVGAGFLLMAAAMFDFPVNRIVTAIGAAAAALLGGIFVLQGISDMVGNAALHTLAFQVLGQSLERVLPNIVVLWFAALLLSGWGGRSRILGWIFVPIAIGLELAAAIGLLIGIEVPFLKLHLFLPFVWLLVGSLAPATKSPVDRARVSGR